jgi:predicted ATP-dependent endonuclease of OLD family
MTDPQEVDISLTPFHALVGPNDSGKSTILRSLRITSPSAIMARFDSDSLRAPSQLIPESQPIAFADDRGRGLPGVFDAIINRDVESLLRIQEGVRSLFPNIARLGLINVSTSSKDLAATLADGTRIGASQLGDGLFYYLGFVALKYICASQLRHNPVDMLLVEAPEKGFHPSRIVDVMKILREISKTCQVVIATHSPLVVNELEGHEVSIVTRSPGKGTQAVLLKDAPGFENAMKTYRLGDFWASYGDLWANYWDALEGTTP